MIRGALILLAGLTMGYFAHQPEMVVAVKSVPICEMAPYPKHGFTA